MTHDELVEKVDNSMTKFLWRLKFVRLMKKRRGYLFSLRDLWEFSDYWFNKAVTPEEAVAMFFGRKPRRVKTMVRHFLLLHGADNEIFLVMAVSVEDAIDTFKEAGNNPDDVNQAFILTEVDLPGESQP